MQRTPRKKRKRVLKWPRKKDFSLKLTVAVKFLARVLTLKTHAIHIKWPKRVKVAPK